VLKRQAEAAQHHKQMFGKQNIQGQMKIAIDLVREI
jgi:hypothetical protein